MMASTTFGPKLRAGDTVAVEVDTLKETVTFYRNQARSSLCFCSSMLGHRELVSSTYLHLAKEWIKSVDVVIPA